jgi:hypothetical protein
MIYPALKELDGTFVLFISPNAGYALIDEIDGQHYSTCWDEYKFNDTTVEALKEAQNA